MKNFSVKTKENFHRNSRESSRVKYVVWIVAALCILMLGKGIVSTVSSWVPNALYTVRHYMQTSVSTVPVFIRSRMELLSHTQELEQELASSQGIAATLAYITAENTELRNLLSASSSPQIVAGVLARPPYTPYDTMVLDKGSDDGIVEYAPVYHGKGIALGYVHAIFPHMSYVTLFSSPGVESTVYIFGANLFTTAYGEGGGVVHLSVPQGIPLTKGDAVVLPSLHTGTLGTVDEIQSIATEPEQHAYVTLGVPLQSIRIVSVGTVPVNAISFDEARTRVEAEEQKRFMISVPEDERVRLSATSTLISTTTATTTP
ncbi:rod shape-determining protein MreC [Candidatus Kaiserbacteria bacterium]|nr:MAG: rod shape-determining protein MreC [Candidatus Kaiserbacteria bacterium]